MRTLFLVAMALGISVAGMTQTGSPGAAKKAASGTRATHVVFVIDTSGSMRNPQTGRLWLGVAGAMDRFLAAHPEVQWCQLFDTDGKRLLGRRDEWIKYDRAAQEEIAKVLKGPAGDSQSSPLPGMLRALRVLLPPVEVDERMHVFVIGDEHTGTVAAELAALAKENPADERGRRPVAISAVQLPTTIQMGGPAGANTGVKFQRLMEEVARLHGGTYELLKDLGAP